MNIKFYLVYWLASAKYEIYSTLNVAVLEEMATISVPQGILNPQKGAVEKNGFVPKYSYCYGLFKIDHA